MDIVVKSHYFERLFSAIQQSYIIKTHLDFFIWLQNSVAEFIPHDALLTVWGDFSGNAAINGSGLQYDVTSNVEGFNTRVVLGATKEVNQCMSYLYGLWLDNNQHLYALNNLRASEFNCRFRSILPDISREFNSLLVYGVSDVRGGNHCLYVFLSTHDQFKINQAMMDLLIPHIDYVLKKIQHLKSAETLTKIGARINILPLTLRELEVIEWIKVGKTNQEIAEILNVTQNTIKSHLKRIYQKLNVGKRAQAVALLAKH